MVIGIERLDSPHFDRVSRRSMGITIQIIAADECTLDHTEKCLIFELVLHSVDIDNDRLFWRNAIFTQNVPVFAHSATHELRDQILTVFALSPFEIAFGV